MSRLPGFLGCLLFVVTCAACSSGSGSDELNACQPLASVTSSVTLDETQIVGAGKAQDGTLYVVLTKDREPRLFVSSDTQLVEQYVNGSGTDGTGTTVMYEDDKGVQHVIEVDGEGADMRMGIATGPLPGKTFEIGKVGEELTLVAASDVTAMPAQSTQTFHADYVGQASDGTFLVVTVPDHVSTLDDYRLFLGPLSAIREQKIVAFNASLSGAKLIDFTFNGVGVEFSYQFGVANGSLATGSMDETFLSSADTSSPAAPMNAVFACR